LHGVRHSRDREHTLQPPTTAVLPPIPDLDSVTCN
jgi:hypothetical protein